MVGHLLGASGAVEAIATVQVNNQGILTEPRNVILKIYVGSWLFVI